MGGVFCLKDMTGEGKLLALLMVIVAVSRWTSGDMGTGLGFLFVGVIVVACSTKSDSKSKSG